MTNLRMIPKPSTNEYPAYSSIYMDLLADDGLVLTHLKDNFYKIKTLIFSLPEEKLYWRYESGKWSIKEILVHIIDDERIFAYRALRYARADNTPLPGFEQDDYALTSDADHRTLDNIFTEYEAVRQSTIALFNGLPEAALMRSGGIAGNGDNRTVRAMAYHIAGHELRHIKIIKERYLELPTNEGIL